MKVSFYLRRPKDNRISVVIAQINFNMTSYRYYLMEKIHPTDWNFHTQRAKQGAKCTESIEFNQHLKVISGKVLEAFYNYQNTHQGQAPTQQVFNELLDDVLTNKVRRELKGKSKEPFGDFFKT